MYMSAYASGSVMQMTTPFERAICEKNSVDVFVQPNATAAAAAAHGASTFAPGGLKRLLVAFATLGQLQQLPVQPASSTGL